MNNDVMFSKKSDEWSTPQWLFDKLNAEFCFGIDVAASDENHLCKMYYTKEDDALGLSWKIHLMANGLLYPAFLNPPYSKIAAFMKKAYEESMKGAVVVCLIPCRTDTRYWHEYVMQAHEIRLIQGRLKFGNEKNSAPFPSCIVIFDHSKYDKNNDPVFTTMRNVP